MDVAALARAVYYTVANRLTLTKDRRNLKFDSHFLKDDALLFQSLLERMSNEARVKLVDSFGSSILGCYHNADFGTQFRAALISLLSEVDPAPDATLLTTDVTATFFNKEITTPLSDLKIILNLKSKRRSILYDTRKDLIHTIDFEIVEDRIRALLDKKSAAQWWQTNSEDCHLGYFPHTQERLIPVPEKDLKLFNLWTEAAWKPKDWRPEPGAPCPVEIDEFLARLSPCPESVRAIKAWLRDATFGRADPILCFIGTPGIGKNILVENLAAPLVGSHNFHQAQRGFNKSQFHHNVSQCRLFFLDEALLTAEGRETLKAYHNGVATIERKGVDVHDPEELHASFVMANNSRLAIKLEYTDRKFFVPTLSQIPLKESWGNPRIKLFLNLLKNPNYISQFSSYLYNEFEAGSSVIFPKTETFKQICIASLTVGLRRFIDVCRIKKTFTHKDFNKGQMGGKRYEFYELLDQIHLYEQQFGEPLAELTLKDNGWVAESKLCLGPQLVPDTHL